MAAFHAVGSPERPEKAMAGILAVSAAYTAAPMVPEKKAWTSTFWPTLGPVTASSGAAPFQRAGPVVEMPVLMDVTG